MRWSWRLWPPVPWGGPERSRFRPGIMYTSRMLACRHDGTRDQLEALAALECPRCPGQPLAPYGPDDANLRICDCCPRIYQMPDDPRDFLGDLDEPQYELVEKPARKQPKQPKHPPTEEPAVTYHPPEMRHDWEDGVEPATLSGKCRRCGSLAWQVDTTPACPGPRLDADSGRPFAERVAAEFGIPVSDLLPPRPRTLTLNCPRCGAEVEFRVDSADVTVAAQTVAGRVHLLRADVDLTGGHTCEVGA